MMLFKKYTDFLLEKTEVEQDPHVSKRDGTQPKKYYKGLSKEKKVSRASHFDRQADKSDSDASAYKDAPGDKKAREKGKLKTSKHTEKYRQMYGEQKEKENKQRNLVHLNAPKSGAGKHTDKKRQAKQGYQKHKGRIQEDDPCWDTHVQKGMKKKGNRMVPNCVPKEEVEIDEAKSGTGYELYHKDFSSAMQHAYDFAKKKYKIEIDPRDIDRKVATGPKRPSSGKANAYRLLDKTGKKAVQVQVTNLDNKRYELNMYTEEVKLKEDPFGITKRLSPLIHKAQYKSAQKELKDLMKKSPKNSVISSAAAIAKKYFNVDARTLAKMVTEDYNEGVATDGISMARIELANLEQDVEDLQEMFMNMQEEPEQWVLSKIAKATDYIESARDYLEFEGLNNSDDIGESLEELELDYELEEEVEAIYEEMLEEEEFDQEFHNIMNESKIAGLVKKAEKSGISYSILKQVYNRGMAAWKGGHRPGASQQQWAFARVNSFITKGKGTWGKADKDLADKVRSSKKEELELDERVELGTDASRIAYARETPGQNPDLVTAKYSADTVLNVLNDIRTQRAKKIYEEEEEITEAEYQGKKVKLNDPFRTSEGPKKFSVYTMGPKGKVVKVNFGDPNMEIKRDDPERRKSFRARHGCDTDPGPKWKAKYWSCKMWEKGKSVSDLD